VGWTGVLALARWAALEPVPAWLSTIFRGPSNCTVTTLITPSAATSLLPFIHVVMNTIAPGAAAVALPHRPVVARGTSIPRMHGGCAWRRVPGWTYLWYGRQTPKLLLCTALESILRVGSPPMPSSGRISWSGLGQSSGDVGPGDGHGRTCVDDHKIFSISYPSTCRLSWPCISDTLTA
jgi:hypothetical protein